MYHYHFSNSFKSRLFCRKVFIFVYSWIFVIISCFEFWRLISCYWIFSSYGTGNDQCSGIPLIFKALPTSPCVATTWNNVSEHFRCPNKGTWSIWWFFYKIRSWSNRTSIHTFMDVHNWCIRRQMHWYDDMFLVIQIQLRKLH
jgi:hypothetical protein